MSELFHVDARYIYQDDTTGSVFEYSLPQVFLADSPKQAVTDAIRWTRRMFVQLGAFRNFLHVGSVNVIRYTPNPIDDDGMCRSPFGETLLEWKCDTGIRVLVNKRENHVEFSTIMDSIGNLKTIDWMAYWHRDYWPELVKQRYPETTE